MAGATRYRLLKIPLLGEGRSWLNQAIFRGSAMQLLSVLPNSWTKRASRTILIVEREFSYQSARLGVASVSLKMPFLSGAQTPLSSLNPRPRPREAVGKGGCSSIGAQRSTNGASSSCLSRRFAPNLAKLDRRRQLFRTLLGEATSWR